MKTDPYRWFPGRAGTRLSEQRIPISSHGKVLGLLDPITRVYQSAGPKIGGLVFWSGVNGVKELMGPSFDVWRQIHGTALWVEVIVFSVNESYRVPVHYLSLSGIVYRGRDGEKRIQLPLCWWEHRDGDGTLIPYQGNQPRAALVYSEWGEIRCRKPGTSTT